MTLLTLNRNVTARDLAMDSHVPGEGYPADHVIGSAGTTVELLNDNEDGWLEVWCFANDPFAEGFIPREWATEARMEA